MTEQKERSEETSTMTNTVEWSQIDMDTVNTESPTNISQNSPSGTFQINTDYIPKPTSDDDDNNRKKQKPLHYKKITNMFQTNTSNLNNSFLKELSDIIEQFESKINILKKEKKDLAVERDILKKDENKHLKEIGRLKNQVQYLEDNKSNNEIQGIKEIQENITKEQLINKYLKSKGIEIGTDISKITVEAIVDEIIKTHVTNNKKKSSFHSMSVSGDNLRELSTEPYLPTPEDLIKEGSSKRTNNKNSNSKAYQGLLIGSLLGVLAGFVTKELLPESVKDLFTIF